MRWLDSAIHAMVMNLGKIQETVEVMGGLGCYSLWGYKKSDTT